MNTYLRIPARNSPEVPSFDSVTFLDNRLGKPWRRAYPWPFMQPAGSFPANPQSWRLRREGGNNKGRAISDPALSLA